MSDEGSEECAVVAPCPTNGAADEGSDECAVVEPAEGSISFTITSSDDSEKKHPFILGPADPPIKIGRYKKNNLCLNNTGVSWVHVEIRLLSGVGEDGRPGLGVRDCSSNGVGLQAPYHDEPKRVEKGVDVEVPHGSLLVLPFKVSRKEKMSDSPQTTLTVEIDGEEVKQSGPVLVTWLPAAPMGGLGGGLGGPMQGAPTTNGLQSGSTPYEGSTRQASQEANCTNVEDLRSESPASQGREARSRSPRRQQGDEFDPEAIADVAQNSGKEALTAANLELLEASNEAKKKKKGKPKLEPGCTVCVKGLSARGELNGKVGTIIEFDQKGGFWKVRMEDGSGKAFKPANLVLTDKQQQDRQARCRALLQGKETQDEEPSDLTLLCRAVMDESKPPPPPDSGHPDDDEPPPPPPGDVPFGPHDIMQPPPPPSDASTPAAVPFGPHDIPQPAMAMQPMAFQGMQQMPMQMGMAQMQMGMPGMAWPGMQIPGMGMPPPPMGMPMPMGFPMGMGMPMHMGMGMPGMVQPPPPAFPPPF